MNIKNISVDGNTVTINGETHTLQPGETITAGGMTIRCDRNGGIAMTGSDASGVTNISHGGDVAVQGANVSGVVIHR